MVAKTLWPIVVVMSLGVSGCQTITPAPEPETTKVPMAILKAEPKPARVQKIAEPKNTAAKQKTPAPEIEPLPDSNEIKTPVPVSEPSPEKVVLGLQQEALKLQSEGQWQAAEVKLERALRIDAQKVDVYHQLATVRMGQQRFAEAEQIAMKGLTFTDQSPKYKAALWQVIAQCKSAQGDIKGAKAARKEMNDWLDVK